MNLDEREFLLRKEIALKNVIRDRLLKQAAVQKRPELRAQIAQWSELEEERDCIAYDLDRVKAIVPTCSPDNKGERRKKGLLEQAERQSKRLQEIGKKPAEMLAALSMELGIEQAAPVEPK
jgi:hypothetical protein